MSAPLPRFAGEVAERSDAGEGEATSTLPLAPPPPGATRLPLPRAREVNAVSSPARGERIRRFRVPAWLCHGTALSGGTGRMHQRNLTRRAVLGSAAVGAVISVAHGAEA